MNIFGEPIGTWISIAAILISLSTLFFSLRKQKYDERTALAKQITDIKTTFGENVRIADQLLSKLEELEKIIGGSKKDREFIELILNRRDKLAKAKSIMENTYQKLGYQSTRTTDPVILSAVSVESVKLGKDLEDVRSAVDELCDEMKKKARKRKPRKLVRNPVKSSTESGPCRPLCPVHAVQWRSEATLVKTLYINWTAWGQPPGFFVENLLLESADRNCE